MTQHDTLTLEPCPHCGKSHTPKIVLASEHWADEYDGDYPHSERYAVMCDASSPNGPGGCGASGGFHAKENEAVEAWNRRAALSATQPAQAATVVPGGMVLAPHYRGYAVLGIGEYLINHTPAGDPAELVISIASDADKDGRVVGDERDNLPGAMIQPEQMAVRVRFENVAGLDALEDQLRYVRGVHFPGSVKQAAQGAGEVVYQIKGDVFQCPHAWRDTDEETFHIVPAKDRRIVYTTPAQPAAVVPDGTIAAMWSLYADTNTAMRLERSQFAHLVRTVAKLLPATPTPPAQAAADARDAFEAEMRREETWVHRSLKKRPNGQYENWQVDLMWGVWKAALATHQQRQDGGA